MTVRLISFLGTGRYGETTYCFEEQECRTEYVAHALASFFRPAEIRIIATSEAWSQHGATLTKKLVDHGFAGVEEIRVPTGGEPQQLWEMFSAIVEEIGNSELPVVLDITHGFRMQPFFAAACIEYVQSVLTNPPEIRVVYGEYRGSENHSPIWELTPFLEVLSWSRNLMMFIRTGQASEVAASAEAVGRQLSRQWAESGKEGPKPQLRTLAQAIANFSGDFTTIRTGSMLVGDQSSSQKLWDCIQQTRAEVDRQLPALAGVLGQVQTMVEPLCSGDARLSSTEGQRVLLALARLYQSMGRYSEAISVLREGWATLGAPRACDRPGTDMFNDSERKAWDKQWAYRDGHADPTAEVRNDIQHAGFRHQPNKPDWFKTQLDGLLTGWEAAIEATEQDNEMQPPEEA